MKAVAAAVIVLLVLALLGWFTIFSGDDRIGVETNPEVVKEDVSNAADAVGDGAERLKDEAERIDVDVDVDRN